ncbi:MAG: MaoC family dehydratase N-terminal domain-containing protein [Deltaproteobacteria bacterium]|nr:MaoC family dehydratase N-terminal domain-containing protein [Deltaproteobacteria bacterium]
MAINPEVVGKKIEGEPFAYDEDTVILYALGIGAGLDEINFIYEKDLKVFPTFAVIPFMPSLIPLATEANLNMFTVLHGEQKIILHKEIPTKGSLISTAVCSSVYDKGDKGAIVNMEIESRDENGELLFENKAVVFDRSGGNFGGDRGPKVEKVEPPEGKNPDFSVSYTTSPDQAALYRLSGDKNPLHIDPEFAKMGGFDKPILHGLCTYGHAGRAALHSVCDGGPARFKSFGVRFTGVVFPGETLITEGWKAETGKYIIQTKAQDGRVVLGNGLAEVN